MSTGLAELQRAREPVPTAEQQFTLARLQEAIKRARVRAADGPLEEIWVDIFEAEHLLHYRFGIIGSLERLTRSLEEYAALRR
jgi:hypothetical protein